MLNKLFKAIVFICLFPFTLSANEIDMADALRESGKIYVVISVIFIIFIGIVAYMIHLDRKISKLEKQLNKS